MYVDGGHKDNDRVYSIEHFINHFILFSSQFSIRGLSSACKLSKNNQIYEVTGTATSS